jgi:hypothetical protein
MKPKVPDDSVDSLPSRQLTCKTCGAASSLFDAAILLKTRNRYLRRKGIGGRVNRRTETSNG